MHNKQFQQKLNIYEQIIGFVPEAIILVSGGIVKEIGKDGVAKYRSTKIDEGDTFGILWGEARTLAVAELVAYFPLVMIITEAIYSEELEQLSVPRDRILLEEKSTNTLLQISETMKIIYEKGLKKVVFVTSEYHISRVRAMYECFESLVQPNAETKCIVREIKRLGVQIQFIAAELILSHRDKKFIEIVDHVKKSSAYIKRIQNEERGVAMIKSGKYGKREIASEDKLERRV